MRRCCQTRSTDSDADVLLIQVRVLADSARLSSEALVTLIPDARCQFEADGNAAQALVVRIQMRGASPSALILVRGLTRMLMRADSGTR